MTQRERHTPDQGPPQPALGPSSLWGEWYGRASAGQQQEALARAVEQGVLYAHQLPTPARDAAPRRPLLSTLLSGPVKDLEPLEAPAAACHDGELDATQRDAVARAAATPDICLIQGFPGTGKSRVVAEIILQAARGGERVLFLAPTPAALDRVLERVGNLPAVCPIRCLTAGESAKNLSPAVARLTLAERLHTYRENTIPAARAARDAARAVLETRRQEEAVWPRLEEVAGRMEPLAERGRALADRRAGLAAEAEDLTTAAEPLRQRFDACTRAWRETRDRLDSQLAGLRAELETIAGKLRHLESEWEVVRPLAEARQGRRFWTGAWWRAVTRGGLAEQLRDLEMRRAELSAARERLERDITGCLAQRTEAESNYQAECQCIKDEEIAHRRSELDAEDAALAREQDALREQGRTIGAALNSSPLPTPHSPLQSEQGRTIAAALPSAPAELSRQAVERARADWRHSQARAEEQVQAAEQWLCAVEAGLSALPQKLADSANVVAATTTALAADAHFGDHGGASAVAFDLLILEEAHQVTESEFAAAARRAKRWVLVGEAQHEAEPAAPRKVVRSVVPRPSFFQRLWHNLHTDPRRLPCLWSRREGRLVCRLHSIAPDQERYVESEPVVDRPEIELRILSIPRQPPRVVEVLFPPRHDIADAKQFLYRELDELAVYTRGRSMTWHETAEEIVLQLAPCRDGEAVTVELEAGVFEHVACAAASDGTCWSTGRLCFRRAAGWTRAAAQRWVAERLGLSSAGRAVLLTVPHRLAPPLARFLSDLLFGGACEPADSLAAETNTRAAVEFVAVPSLESLEERHRAADARRPDGRSQGERGSAAVSVRAPNLRAVKGGAGLELELADHRPLEQLPSHLRAALPRQGLVNYLEACALVKRLEALIGEADFRAACQRWHARHARACEHGCASLAECVCPRPENGPAVGVMALYPAQAELLRYLIRQSSTLAGGPVAVEVGPPAAFGQRECLLALVSLTRSHTHRAVCYGDHPNALAQALTRAVAGVILFGDPGTLARRSQWRGALDHLDEAAARREGILAGQLVRYLQGHGPHPAAFHLHEGDGV